LILVAWQEGGGGYNGRKLLENYVRRMLLVCILRQLVETRNCDEKLMRKSNVL